MCGKTSKVTPEKNNKESVADIINEKVENKVFIDIDDDISVELDTKKYNIHIKDSDNNKFIGYVDLGKKFSELHIGDIYIYEKYIVLEEYHQDGEHWYVSGFCVYEYNENLKIMEYLNSGNKLYEANGPYWFKGIKNDLLFIDEGSGPGTRGLEIFDLANNVSILNRRYYNSFSFHDNIVSGLEMSGWDGEPGFNDDIKTKFYEFEEKTNMPDWLKELDSRFIVIYDYNILTKEINLSYGEYIFVQ
jgi:hypothetical protein